VIITDNILYAKIVHVIGMKKNIPKLDLNK